MKQVAFPNLDRKFVKQQIENRIVGHLENLDKYEQSDDQKITEICHLGKLLVNYFPKFHIEEVRESPDFIISNGLKRIGVEHQIIVDEKVKRTQGFYENIFRRAERDLQEEPLLPNFMAICILKKSLSFSNSDKSQLIQTVKEIVVEFVSNDNLIENPLIGGILKLPHNKKRLHPKFGAYMEKDLEAKKISEFINKKESKLDSYRQNTNIEQWLLLVTEGHAEYSFNIENPIELINIPSKFDKIYLMDGFNDKLFELK